jgi:hypothetical protein
LSSPYPAVLSGIDRLSSASLDEGVPVSHAPDSPAVVLPTRASLPVFLLAKRDAERTIGLRDLGERMWSQMRETRPGQALEAALAQLPEPRLAPREAEIGGAQRVDGKYAAHCTGE